MKNLKALIRGERALTMGEAATITFLTLGAGALGFIIVLEFGG